MTLVFGYVRAITLEEVKQGSNERQKDEILRYAKAKQVKTPRDLNLKGCLNH